jgi:hypothetical protein
MQRLHFSDELTVVKILDIELLAPFRLARIASAMPAMTNPYSMAVAAERSAQKPESKSFKRYPPGNGRTESPAFDDETLNPGLKEFANLDG